MPKLFFGFGFGAIQAGLFLYEAQQSGQFDKLVVAYRRPEIITAIRKNQGYFGLNIAHHDHNENVSVGPVTMLDIASEHEQILESLAQASEISTAVASVGDYISTSKSSIHRLLAQGLRLKLERKGPKAIIYTAENDNHAAEKLEQAVFSLIPVAEQQALSQEVQFLNTVIGKMSASVTDSKEIQEKGLSVISPGLAKAFLVESYNRILISQVRLNAFSRGLRNFEEKPDLLPFEEAKLYGHNAVHALAAYLSSALGLNYIRELESIPGAMGFLREAFLQESGAALIHKYQGVDALFSPQAYAAYADDLLKRMLNPFLNDTAERVGRDPSRKLAWDDRLIGTLRLAIHAGIRPKRFAFGVAAALVSIKQAETYQSFLKKLWQKDQEVNYVLDLITEALAWYKQWQAQGKTHLQTYFSGLD